MPTTKLAAHSNPPKPTTILLPVPSIFFSGMFNQTQIPFSKQTNLHVTLRDVQPNTDSIFQANEPSRYSSGCPTKHRFHFPSKRTFTLLFGM
eukprot:c7312_g1_i1 orf=282-557(+)